MREMTAKRSRVDLQIFLLRDFFETRGDFTKRQRSKMKMLRARPDGVHQILRLRGGHHKDHPIRWLFESLQQRVGSLAGKHVRLVQNHHFASRRRRSIAHHLSQFADLIDASIGGRVNLNYIQGSPRSNLAARIAFPTRRRSWTMHTVQSFGENARRGSFANPSRAGKNVRMRHAIVLNRIRRAFP